MGNYRVAIVGCGPRGSAISLAYAAHPRTTVVAVCDLRRELRDRLGETLRLSYRYADLDEMISATKPDLVVIATGTEFHHELALRVLAHGVHIDIEKPLTTDLRRADEVLKLARKKRVRVAVHHQGRVCASMRAVARALREGRIGRVRHLIGSGKGYYGGYGLLNIGTHTLNAMLRLAGPCAEVSGTLLVDRRPARPEDVVLAPNGMGPIAGEDITASLRFANGITGTLLHQRFPVVDATAHAIEVLGTEGRLLWKNDEAHWLPQPHFVPDGEHDHWQRLSADDLPGYDPNACGEAEYAFADEYVRALDEGREHECSGAEGLHVMEIMMGIFESGAMGRPVALPQRKRDHPLLRWRAQAGLPEPPAVSRNYPSWLLQEDRRLGRS
ncbi:MAG: Gfo/Idh/MocA family oxidoreductase [Chloroflexi bacterium]|nr:Gfo/Idh/MocA family oxidoreductase [Chloroflexota bacterium]